MKCLLPDGRIEGAKPINCTAVRATPAQPERPVEAPGDVTTVWRDGEVWRQSPGQHARMMPATPPIIDSMDTTTHFAHRRSAAFTLVETLIVLVIVALLAATVTKTVQEQRARYSPDTYSAWCKVHRRNDLSFDEWKAAKKAGLLDSLPVPTMEAKP